MDHETATRTHTTERYILGQLTPAERDAFEDHLAGCTYCMDDVTTADSFAANAHAVFRDRATAQAAVPARSRWFDFLRLRPVPVFAFSGALNLLLLGFVGYGTLRVIPALQTQVALYERPAVTPSFRLAGNTRGASDVFTVKSPAAWALLRFDQPTKYTKYAYLVEGEGVRRNGDLPASSDSETLNLVVPVAGLPAGDYRVTLTGSDGAHSEQIGTCRLRIEP